MQPANLLVPVCYYTFFLITMLLALGVVRVVGRFRGLIPADYLRAGIGERPPEWIHDLHHHFSNQFELPMLFYFGCTLSVLIGSTTEATVGWAWTFVVARVLHSAIVLIRNLPQVRVFPFILSTVCVGFIWGEVLSQVLIQANSSG